MTDTLPAELDPFDTPYVLPARPFDPRTAGRYEISEEGIERDQWGRPLILPPPGGWADPAPVKGQRVSGERPYTRWSTIAQHAEPMRGLGIYLQRMQALAIARMPDLQEWLCGLTYQDGSKIDLILTEAMLRLKEHQIDTAARHRAATRGSAFHTFTTPGQDEPHPAYGPHTDAFNVSARQFREALHRTDLEIVSTERFVVDDATCAAGTYDHLVRDKRSGAVRVLDKKTGSLHWPGHRVQCAGYAASQHYDAATGERTPLHPDLDRSLIYIAATDLASGNCVIFECDVEPGEHAGAATMHRRASAAHEKRTMRART